MEILSNKLQGQEQFNQESFSFSSFDFNSSLGIFTDDDEDDEHENDEAYIEITLEQEQEHEHEHEQIPPNSSTQGRGDDHGNDLELLRVSFSSVVPFPGFSCSSANDISACNFSSMNTGRFSSSSANTERQTETGEDKVLCIDGRSNNGGRMGYTALNRLVDVLLSTLKLKGSSSSSAVLLGNQNGRQPEKRDSWELVRSRKAPTKVNGGARKLLIKFRSINILSMVASFVKPKPRQVIASSPINNTRTSHKEAITPPRTYPTQSNSQRNINKHLEGTKRYTNLGRRKGENSRLLEMNFDSITRMVEAVSKNIIGARGKNKLQSKSCPGSIKSSPIHQEGKSVSSENKIYARDNSVQAAIAHCKQSFGQYR